MMEDLATGASIIVAYPGRYVLSTSSFDAAIPPFASSTAKSEDLTVPAVQPALPADDNIVVSPALGAPTAAFESVFESGYVARNDGNPEAPVLGSAQSVPVSGLAPQQGAGPAEQADR